MSQKTGGGVCKFIYAKHLFTKRCVPNGHTNHNKNYDHKSIRNIKNPTENNKHMK